MSGIRFVRSWNEKKQCRRPAMAFIDDCVVDPHTDPAFYFPTDSDLNPGQTLLSLKVEFFHEKYTNVGNRS